MKMTLVGANEVSHQKL